MATIVKLAPNVATKVKVKYMDIVPGEKYGPQVRIKGVIGDEKDGMLYSPGNLADALTALIAGGVIANKEYPTDVEKAVDLNPKKKEFELVLTQAAGEKHGTLRVVGAPAAAAPSPSAQPMQGNGQQPKLTGLYRDAAQFWVRDIHPILKGAGIEVSAEAAVAGIATVYISAVKER